MMEKLAELIWKALEPKIAEVTEKAYIKGGEDMIRRFAFVYDAVAKTAKEDVYADAGAIPIEEISKEQFDAIVDDMGEI